MMFFFSALQWMVSGCPGWTGQTVPVAVVECRFDTEVASLLATEAETVLSSLDHPIWQWKSVRAVCELKLNWSKNHWFGIRNHFRLLKTPKKTPKNPKIQKITNLNNLLFLPCSTAEPCPDDGCANTSCPTGLVTHNCAPCPVSCAHITSVTTCDSTAPCFSGQSGGIFNILCSMIKWLFLDI